MEIRSLTATFGRLNNETLDLQPGLNIIEAANEIGKSTWMAFLRVMLYGISTRDRSATADKRRYFPWNGTAMQGRMDLTQHGAAVTLSRATTRANSPMGSFSASYTGTATSVPNLSADSCGETLLGIPLEIFERSAFIRQSGLSFDHNAALERRIASLITTGEEDSSYTDAADRLRKQRNRRRHNKTGLLPRLEEEIRSLENTLGEFAALNENLRALESQQGSLDKKEAELRRELKLVAAAENAQRAAEAAEARSALDAARSAWNTLISETSALPSKSELSRLAEDLTAAEAMQRTANDARTRSAECSAALHDAETLLAAHPFAPQSPGEVAAAFTPTPCPTLPRWLPVISSSVGALIPILAFALRLSLPLSIAAAFVVAGLYLGTLFLIDRDRKKRWRTESAREELLHRERVDAYTLLYDDTERKRSAARAARDSVQTLSTEAELHLGRALSHVRQFSTAQTPEDAHRAIRSALDLLAKRDTAEQHMEQAQLRFTLLSEHAPKVEDLPEESPSHTREEVEEALRAVTEDRSVLHRQIHMTQGRIQTLGDSAQLHEELSLLRERHDAVQKEYDAIELAEQVLGAANTSLQNRFSPALGEKAASIFTKLTKGKYNKVLLDKNMIPSAQTVDDALSHEAILLSQGTADQLYLAVRLAVCDMVLPEGVPVFLDDALVTFDDARMAATLDYLTELSATRQILLFTCQHRELTYLSSAHPDRYHAVVLK